MLAIDIKEGNRRLSNYSILILLIISGIRVITILNPYNLNRNIDFIKIINNYKNYNYLYKGLKRPGLCERKFTTFSSLLNIAIVIFSLNILLETKAISRTFKIIKQIKKNLVFKSRI
ncbi:hypothetical protein CTRI78_v012234 [Colletotrichum trifolii]|uniref:Uncharacterized protein n=1 Tax=Colletotrichum trifolii TaxID=5466 RepID=A0A4R8PXA4_COLTR|nr:hypothetical protein CTRI78_v012234 [Colletotrichum trifolii]